MSIPNIGAEPEPTPKPKRKSRPRPQKPIRVITLDGREKVFGDTYAETLRSAEDDVLASINDLLDGTNENACVTAAAKLLDALEDRSTPERIRSKLEKHKQNAVDTLLRISRGEAYKPTARAQANAQLIKAMKNASEAVWPPDTTKAEWSTRMERAKELCAAVTT